MNPFIALQMAQAAISAGSQIASFFGQNKAHKANTQQANNAYFNTISALNLRGAQETDATQQSIMQTDRQARTADGLARVSAGESGVAGASVDAVLSDITQQGLNANTTQRRNLAMNLAQLNADKAGALAERDSRIASLPRANPFMLGLQIAGDAASAGSNSYAFMSSASRKSA